MSKEETKKVVDLQHARQARDEDRERQRAEIRSEIEFRKQGLSKLKDLNKAWDEITAQYPDSQIIKSLYPVQDLWRNLGILVLTFKTDQDKEWFLSSCEIAFSALEQPSLDGQSPTPHMITNFTSLKFFYARTKTPKALRILFHKIMKEPGGEKLMHLRVKDTQDEIRIPV